MLLFSGLEKGGFTYIGVKRTLVKRTKGPGYN